MPHQLLTCLSVNSAVILPLLFPVVAIAQVPESGPNSLGTLVNPGFSGSILELQVTGGKLSNDGRNLFHGFETFSPNMLPVRFFDQGAENIFVRVTGNPLVPESLSLIEQQLAVNNGANLFLLNPDGVTFGAGASLDLDGDFFASTATSIAFGSNNFDRDTTMDGAMLLVDVPKGLQLGVSPIEVNQGAQLVTQPGSTLSLVGAGIDFDGGEVISNRGRINLISAADSELTLNPDLSPNCNSTGCPSIAADAYQDISLSNASGARVLAGDLTALGHNITLTEGSRLVTRPDGTEAGGTVSVLAQDTLRLAGGNLSNESGLFAENLSANEASPGNMEIRAGELRLQNGARLTTSTDGVGDGGSIEVITSQILIDGTSPADGDPSGIFSNSLMGAMGAGGPIELTTNQLTISNGGTISSRTTSPEKGGAITIDADQLTLINQASLTVSAAGGSEAGDINITATNINQTNQGNIQATTESGLGGNINFNVAENIVLRFNSEIVTEAQGSGNGGNINFDVGGFILGILAENSDVVAGSESGQGGRITGNAKGIFTFRQFDGVRTPLSDFTAASGSGLDGTVDVQTPEPPSQEPLEDAFAGDDIAQGCNANPDPDLEETAQSRFVILNLGGLPAQPSSAGSTDALLISPVDPIADSEPNAVQPNPETFAALAVFEWPCDDPQLF